MSEIVLATCILYSYENGLVLQAHEATPCPSVFFRESAKVEGTVRELRQANVAVFEIDGGALS